MLTALEIWTYTRLYLVSVRKKTNIQILWETEALNYRIIYNFTVKRRRARYYYGHVMSSLQKTIMNGKANGKRGCGGTRTIRLDNVISNMGFNINTFALLAMYKERWLTKVSYVGINSEHWWKKVNYSWKKNKYGHYVSSVKKQPPKKHHKKKQRGEVAEWSKTLHL